MKKGNDSKKKVLASLVMGLNCVNSFAPMAVAVNVQAESVPARPVKETVTEPDRYTAACYQALDVVDSAIFGTAEAAFTQSVGTAFATSSVNGETVEDLGGGVFEQVIYAGGIATDGIINPGGRQNVSAGGIGNITTMDDGTQNVFAGGKGNITTMDDGTQNVSGGVGTVTTMNSGLQNISGGRGTVITMNSNGFQRISNGTGNITTMNSGTAQNIYSGGTGIVTTMNNSTWQNGTGTEQLVYSGGTGIVTTINGGKQTAYYSAIVSATTLNSGRQIISGGRGTVTTMNGGSQTVRSGGTGTVTTMNNGGYQNIFSGGTATVVTMNGGVQTIYGGTGTAKALNGGTQVVFENSLSLDTTVNGGTMSISKPKAVIRNATLESGKIVVVNASGGNFKLSGNFIGNGGTVDLTEPTKNNTYIPNTYETLTIENLYGNQTTFLMNTDLKSETDGDKIIVENAATVTGGLIQVYDKSLVDGTNLEGKKKLLLVTDNSGITTWTGKSLDTGGLWTITPTIENEGNEWYLVLEETPVNPPPVIPNPTAKTFSAFTDAAYGNWRTVLTDDTLRKRLGDLRYGDKEQGGVWARVKAGKLDAGNSEGSYQMYQVGIDKKVANTAYGLAIDHMTGKDTYELGSGKNSMTNLSLYATSYHPSGAYSDVVLKAGKYRGDVNTYSDNDSADYNSWAYSASYEVGKTISKSNGFFIEPEVQLVLGKLQGADYTSNNGIDANREGATSFLGRVGFVAGRKISDSGDYYFKANMWREFAGGGDVNLSAVNNYGDREYMTKSAGHKDTWFELGVGCNAKVGQNTYFYGDVLKTFGADIQKKWQANVGMRFAF